MSRRLLHVPSAGLAGATWLAAAGADAGSAPQGGAAPDYVGWAREVAGIVKAFAFRTGAGYVTVYPLQAITGADRIPAAPKIAEVEAYVGADERRPLCANVVGAAMVELDVDITITGLAPNDAETKANIQAALPAGNVDLSVRLG